MSIRGSNSAPSKSPPISDRGPSLFGHFYFALFIGSASLAYTVYAPREDGFLWIQIWTGILAAITLLCALARDLFHDWFASISMPGKVWYFVIVTGAFVSPELLRGHSANPEGFISALPLLMLFCASEPVARLTIGFLIAGYWFALPGSPIPAPYAFLLPGACALWTLSAAHFAFTGYPFRLRGWWPARRVVFNTVLYFIPSALAAMLMFFLWPSIAPSPVVQPVAAERSGIRPPQQLSLTEMLLQAAMYFALIFGSLIALHLIRRYFSRRAKPPALPDVKLTNVADVEMREADPQTARAGLGGNRGKIVNLWWRWARRADAADLAHAPGETAAELAERLAKQTDPEELPLEITRLMEIAHYGPAEPSSSEVEAMRNLVNQDKKVE